MRSNTYRWKNECEAACPALARAVTVIFGRKFQLCRHHKNKIDGQLVELAADQATMDNPLEGELQEGEAEQAEAGGSIQGGQVAQVR